MEETRSPYNVFFSDQSFLTFDFTVHDYQAVVEAMLRKGVAKISFGVIDTADIRAIVEVVQVQEQPVQPTESGTPVGLSPEEQQYLAELQKKQREAAGV